MVNILSRILKKKAANLDYTEKKVIFSLFFQLKIYRINFNKNPWYHRLP